MGQADEPERSKWRRWFVAIVVLVIAVAYLAEWGKRPLSRTGGEVPTQLPLERLHPPR